MREEYDQDMSAGEGGALLSNAPSEVGQLLIAMQPPCQDSAKCSWDRVRSKSEECDCISIQVQNEGRLALDQKQIGARYVIIYIYIYISD